MLAASQTIVAGTGPTTWTKVEGSDTTVDGAYTVALFWGIATEAGEKDYEFKWGSAASNAVTISAVKDFDSSSPIAALAFKNNTTGSKEMKFASVSPAMTNTLSMLFGQSSGSITAPGGYTERVDIQALNLCTGELAASGPSGEKVVTNSETEDTATWHVAVAPVPEGEPTAPVRGSLNLLGVGR